MSRRWLLACLTCLPLLAQAFDLPQLTAQLRTQPLVRGTFIQEKFLRGLPRPLTSRGDYLLMRDAGLLWSLRSPLQQTYRIRRQGIDRQTAEGWQPANGQQASSQQNQLTLALIGGDTARLQEDFDLSLQGKPDAWSLDLEPRSALLRQVFERIQITGGAYVERVELSESQGDRTRLTLSDAHTAPPPSDAERAAFEP